MDSALRLSESFNEDHLIQSNRSRNISYDIPRDLLVSVPASDPVRLAPNTHIPPRFGAGCSFSLLCSTTNSSSNLVLLHACSSLPSPYHEGLEPSVYRFNWRGRSCSLPCLAACSSGALLAPQRARAPYQWALPLEPCVSVIDQSVYKGHAMCYRQGRSTMVPGFAGTWMCSSERV